MGTLDNLRLDAKRWLKRLRSGDAEARTRLERVHPKPPAIPTLRDVQLAIARERGFAGWSALKADAERHDRERAAAGASAPTERSRVDAFLEAACPDAHVVGPMYHKMARHAAMRILSRHPEVARDNLYAACVCGDLEEVQRMLEVRPEAASEAGGPKAWQPLLYLCNARLPLAAAVDNAPAIATALIEHGADPNALYLLHGTDDYRYTALTGVLGRGEEEAPTHPAAEPLSHLLLEHGAEPYDQQLLYNVFADNSSRGLLADDIVWLLDAIYTHAVRRGRSDDWRNPEWPMLDPWGEGHGAAFLLEGAVDRNLLRLAEWLLTHGAGPNAARHVNGRRVAPYERAIRRGFRDMAALLVRFGASPGGAGADDGESPEDAFVSACLRLDRSTVRAEAARHPEFLRSTRAIFAAVDAHRADVVELLLDVGVSPDVEAAQHGGIRPLHMAAAADDATIVSLLIERGAEVDARDRNWNATPLGFAVFGERQRAIEVLSRVSRDVFNLTFTGKIERLRELVGEAPQLATAVNPDGRTLLMRLPDDEHMAQDTIDLLIAHGADPTHRTRQGRTAADMAHQRGLERAAERLRRMEGLARRSADASSGAEPK